MPIYSAPVIVYPRIAGFTLPANPSTDSSVPDLVIPLVLTAFSPLASKPKVNLVTSIPIVEEGTIYGGAAISPGASDVPKLQFEGFIDTPTDASHIPTIVAGTQKMTYAEYMIMCLEGRAEAANGVWKITEPLWFRDPYGRVYSSTRVVDLQASPVESVPGRSNVSMSLTASSWT